MVWTRQSNQSTLRPTLLRSKGDTNVPHVFYIGLGDQFDDERRLVRETASVVRL
jgi:hypothetical protein